MKVLVFTSLYPNHNWPNQGVFVKERMAQFAKLDGCDVKVVAPVPYFPAVKLGWRWKLSQVARKEIREGMEVHHPRYLMIPKVGMALYGWMMFLSVLPQVKKIKRGFDFDLIDAHYVYPDGFAAIQLGRFFKRPVVVSARGSDVNLFKTFPLVRKLVRYVLTKADRVIAVSEALKAAMIELNVPEDKITVIPNGVDAAKFYPIAQEEARKKLGWPNRKTILSVGNLTDNKGFDLLVKSVRLLSDKFPETDIHMAIVGDGPARGKLEKTISSLKLDGKVRLVGAVPHDQLRLWYSAADLFCLASGREGWPNVLLEALACGTPVVATAVGGIPEIIRSEKVGLLTEREETKIAAAIFDAMNRNWQSDAILHYAREHTWSHTAVTVRGIFQSLLEGKPEGATKLLPAA
jgi:glycosyltransferase involved in cell wall biosynthesis